MKNLFALCGLSALLLASCATVRQNVDARTYLAQCHYEYAGLKVTGVRFSSGILIDSVDLDVMVKVTNTTDRDVALDHVNLSFYFDDNHALDLDHNEFTRIAPKAASVATVAAGLPFAGIFKSLGHRPETLGVKAKLWVTLLVGKDSWQTPIVIPLEVKVPVPYDQIDAFVAQRQKQLEDEAAAQARKAAESAKKALPSVTLPHL